MNRYKRERGYLEKLLHKMQSPAAIFDHELWRLGSIYYRESGILGVTKYWQSNRKGWVVRVTTLNATQNSVRAVAHLINEEYAQKNAEALHYASGFGGAPDSSEESIQRTLFTFEDIDNFLLDVREKYIDYRSSDISKPHGSSQNKIPEASKTKTVSIYDSPGGRAITNKIAGHLYCQKCGENDIPGNFLESEIGENYKKCPKCFAHFQALNSAFYDQHQLVCPKCNRKGGSSSFFDSEAGQNFKKCPSCSMNFQAN
jgi:uncharacterized C2H2 Zn-finger protein